MKHKLCALILAILLGLPLCLPARAAQGEEGVHPERLIPALKEFFAGAEGDYGSVNPRDNGAVSLGLLQWHGRRALELVRSAADRDPEAARRLLGGALYAEIRSSGTCWDRRCLSPAEAAAVSALLSSPAGRLAQDALAESDITAYITAARRAGMRTDATVFYFATICNQFGAGGAQTYLARICQTLGAPDGAEFYDLDELHAAVRATAYGAAHLGLRDKTYDYLLALGWQDEENGASVTGMTEAPAEAERTEYPDPMPRGGRGGRTKTKK